MLIVSGLINQFHLKIAFHPGETLKEKLKELKLTKEEFAISSRIPLEIIRKLIKGKHSIDSEIAFLLEIALGIPSRFWIKKQKVWDEYNIKI